MKKTVQLSQTSYELMETMLKNMMNAAMACGNQPTLMKTIVALAELQGKWDNMPAMDDLANGL